MIPTPHPADALPLRYDDHPTFNQDGKGWSQEEMNAIRAAHREGYELAMGNRADEYRRAVMGEGKVAIGICKDADSGIPGIIYLDMGGEQRQIDEDTSDLFEPGTQADPSKILACVHFWTPGAVLQTIGVLHELLKKEFGVGPSSNVEALAPSKSNESVLRSALNAMLTHFGMDEDEWSKPTFDQARAALASQPAQEQAGVAEVSDERIESLWRFFADTSHVIRIERFQFDQLVRGIAKLLPERVSDEQIEAAAKIVAERFDYPWAHMPEEGRNHMRDTARAILALKATAGAPIVDRYEVIKDAYSKGKLVILANTGHGQHPVTDLDRITDVLAHSAATAGGVA